MNESTRKDKDIDDLEKYEEIILNPFYFILLGNESLDEEEYEQAIREYSKTIELDDRFTALAFYYRGYCRVRRYAKKNF